MGTLMVNNDLAVVVEEGAQIRAIQLRKIPTLMADNKILSSDDKEGVKYHYSCNHLDLGL
jgi:hypothetical protein